MPTTREKLKDIDTTQYTARELAGLIGCSPKAIWNNPHIPYRRVIKNPPWKIDRQLQAANIPPDAFYRYIKNSEKLRKEIADDLGVHQMTLRSWMRYHRYPLENRGHLISFNSIAWENGYGSEREYLEYLYKKHKSSRKVGDILDSNPTTILARLKEYGIPVLPKGGPRNGGRKK